MIGQVADIFVGSMQQLAGQTMVLVPKVIIAVIIWWAGKHLIKLGVGFIDKIDLGFDALPEIVAGVGKFVLILVVLDYLGIGRTVIGAVLNGMTLAVAIALGIAFGEALKGEAKKAVSLIKKQIKK